MSVFGTSVFGLVCQTDILPDPAADSVVVDSLLAAATGSPRPGSALSDQHFIAVCTQIHTSFVGHFIAVFNSIIDSYYSNCRRRGNEDVSSDVFYF